MEGHPKSLESILLKEAEKHKAQIQLKISNLIGLRKKSATERIMSKIEIDRLMEELSDEHKIQVEHIQRIVNAAT